MRKEPDPTVQGDDFLSPNVGVTMLLPVSIFTQNHKVSSEWEEYQTENLKEVSHTASVYLVLQTGFSRKDQTTMPHLILAESRIDIYFLHYSTEAILQLIISHQLFGIVSNVIPCIIQNLCTSRIYLK